jgi:hypothetical protein
VGRAAPWALAADHQLGGQSSRTGDPTTGMTGLSLCPSVPRPRVWDTGTNGQPELESET